MTPPFIRGVKRKKFVNPFYIQKKYLKSLWQMLRYRTFLHYNKKTPPFIRGKKYFKKFVANVAVPDMRYMTFLHYNKKTYK